MGRTRSFGYIRTRKRENGNSYQASYIDPATGKRRTKTFRAKKDATAFLAKIALKIDAGETLDAPKPRKVPTVKEWGEEWQKRLKDSGASPNSLRSYKSHLKRYIYPAFESRAVNSISRAEVIDWFYKTAPDKPGARKNAYTTFSALMGAAVDSELIEVSPVRVKGAAAKKRARDEDRERVATDEQVEEIAGAMPGRLSIMVFLAAWAGLRYGEIAALRRRHIDLKERRIMVRGAVKRGETGRLIEGVPKSALGRRDVPISDQLAGKLKDHLDQYVGKGADSLLVYSDAGTFLSNKTLHFSYNDAVTAAGLPGFSFHQLRATCATMLARAGATEAEIQAILGHSTWSMSQIYQRATRERLVEVVNKMHEGAGE